MSTWAKVYAILWVLVLSVVAGATNYYVGGPNASNSNNGASIDLPFATIQKAADVMQPGDTALIRGGTYRESIVPPRGGTSESARITYKAYGDESPVIDCSERVTTWVDQGGNVWKVDLPDSYFGSYNPYTTLIGADHSRYLNRGKNNHTGDVFLNGSIYREEFSLGAVQSSASRWYTSHSGSTTTIYANFGGANPNTQTAEIQLREFVIFPTSTGISYITLDGLTMIKAATKWEENTNDQTGMIVINGGKSWLIQNCRLSYSKCAGIAMRPNTSFLGDISTYGHHRILNNVIEKCGETGICGHNGAIASLIQGNLIQDINYRNQFGGVESGGIKLHYAIDVTIKNNIIRRIISHGDVVPGIWLDWSCQGTRITGNVIYNAGSSAEGCIYLEANHGPILIDNNIFGANPLCEYSERTVVVHNLFINAGIYLRPGDTYGNRSSQYWVPHTRTRAGSSTWSLTGDKYYNNIFVGRTQTNSETTTNYAGGNNVFYQGATPFSVISGNTGIDARTYSTGATITNLPDGVRVSFKADNSLSAANCPLITNTFIGTYSVVNQGIENADGSPITVDTDILGNARNASHPLAGPFENIALNSTTNAFVITAGPGATRFADTVSRVEAP